MNSIMKIVTCTVRERERLYDHAAQRAGAQSSGLQQQPGRMQYGPRGLVPSGPPCVWTGKNGAASLRLMKTTPPLTVTFFPWSTQVHLFPEFHLPPVHRMVSQSPEVPEFFHPQSAQVEQEEEPRFFHYKSVPIKVIPASEQEVSPL